MLLVFDGMNSLQHKNFEHFSLEFHSESWKLGNASLKTVYSHLR